ncbi:MAG: hypothetical protein PHQ23_09830 [Candidatus Wallbacteria bacterium]|nr:hypothetical protein [Candidatus Wallbacteria bacterium]
MKGKGILLAAFMLLLPAARALAQADNRAAILDNEAPKVVNIRITDPTPNSSHSMIYPEIFGIGELAAEIEFSEDMDTKVYADTSKMMEVALYLGNNREIKITNGSWLTRRYWVGALDSDAVINQFSDNGKIWVVVRYARDMAGNRMNEQKSAIYYLDISPRFTTPKIFPNPISTKDFIVSVESSEELIAPPQIFVWSKVVDMKQISGTRFVGSIYLEYSTVGVGAIRISGTDLQGNTGHWPQNVDDYPEGSAPGRFMVSAVGTDGGIVESPDGKVSVTVPPGGIYQEQLFLTMTEKPDQAEPWYGSIVDGSDVITVFPGALLRGRAAVALRSEAEYDKIGLFAVETGGLRFLGRASHSDGCLRAETPVLGRLVFAADSNAPEFEITSSGAEEASGIVRVRITDDLSGVDWTGLKVTASGRMLTADDMDAGSGWAVYRCPVGFEGEMVFTVSDQLGNAAESRFAPAVRATAKLNYLRFYPQPAFEDLNIDFSFDQVPGRVKLVIYDSAGRRVMAKDLPAAPSAVETVVMRKNGRLLGSGVYFYILSAEFNGGYCLEWKGKISLLGGEGL